MIARFATAAALMWCLCAPAIAQVQHIEPDLIHSVEVNRYAAGAPAAEALRTELTDKGYAPVAVVSTPEGASVRVGQLPIYADAHLLWEDLRLDYPGAQVVNEPSISSMRLVPVTAPVSSREIFNLQARPLVSEEPLIFNNEAAAIRDGGQLVEIPETPETQALETEALELTVIAKDPSDLARGLAYFMIADIRAGRGDLMNALDLAMEVANESLLATPQKRYEAMWLVARIHHATRTNRVTAYRAYRELEAVINHEPDMARCLVEEAGLLVELFRHHETGRYEDARLKCQEVLERFADSDNAETRARCATAALMLAHSYQFTDADEAVRRCEYILQRFPEVRREACSAAYFAGHVRYAFGRFDEAERYLQRAVAMNLQRSEDFPNVDKTQQALQLLQSIAMHRGDHEAVQRYGALAAARGGDPRAEVSHRWNQDWPTGPPTPAR